MNILSNIKFTFRLFYKNASSSVLGVLVLAMGLAMSITMFTLSKTMLWDTPTFKGGKDVVSVAWVPELRAQNRRPQTGINVPDLEEFQEKNQSFETLAAYQFNSYAVFNPDSTQAVKRYDSARITGNFFDLLGVQPVLGRVANMSDVTPDAPTVAVIGFEVWQNEFEGSAEVIGKTVQLNGLVHTVVGVMPEGFLFPISQKIWVPSRWKHERPNGRNSNFRLNLIGMLKEGVTLEKATLELEHIAANIKAENPKTNEFLNQIKIEPYDRIVANEQLRAILYILLGGSLLVLLISCANVSNLLLARVGKRQFELVMRKVLGASRLEICYQILLDAVFVAIIGAVFAYLLAGWACVYIWNIFSENYESLPYWWNMDLDARVLGFSFIVLILSILTSSISPLVKMLAKHNAGVLKDNVRTSSGLSSGKAGTFLVGMQITFTTLLLCTAAFFVNSTIEMKDRELVFDPKDVLSTSLDVTYSAGYETPASIVGFYQNIEQNIKAIPGVKDVSFSFSVMNWGNGNRKLEVENRALDSEEDATEVYTNIITNGYFDVFNAQPVLGRYFLETDTSSSQAVAVVNQRFVTEYFPNENPIGQRIRVFKPGFSWENQNRDRTSPWTQWLTIVGVTSNIISGKGIEGAKKNGNVARYLSVYIPDKQWPSRNMSLLLTGEGNVEKYAKSVSRVIAMESTKLAPKAKYETIETMLLRYELFPTLIAQFVGSFGLVALIMAAVGLYGLASFTAEQKNREYGIRMALGAGRKRIVRLVLGTAKWQLLIGLILGLSMAYALNSVIAQQLAVNGEGDSLQVWYLYPVSMVIVAAIMVFSVLVPALRAANKPPNEMLFQD